MKWLAALTAALIVCAASATSVFAVEVPDGYPQWWTDIVKTWTQEEFDQWLPDGFPDPADIPEEMPVWEVPEETPAEAIDDRTPVSVTPTAGSAIDTAAVQKFIDEADAILPSDPDASESAVRLLKYLYAVGKTDDVLFGRQRDTDAKAGYSAGSDSDTRDMTGTIPAVVGADTNESIVFSPQNAAKISIDAAGEGAIITLSAHMPDFSQMEISDIGIGYSAKNGQSTKGVAAHILPGGDKNAVYTAYLDLIAEYAKLLDDEDIPILFRPFHEHTGSWFWWGKGMISEKEYIDLWRYTADYLRETKNIHNILYVFSPDDPGDRSENYFYAYPGDDYVDVLGLDYYDSQWHGPTFEAFLTNLEKRVSFAHNQAEELNKPFALTETGVQNAPDWAKRPAAWFSDVMNAIRPYNVSYFLAWASWNTTQYMIPYKTSETTGHPNVDAFIEFYNDPHSVFADGTKFYGDALSYGAETEPAATPTASEEPTPAPTAEPTAAPTAEPAPTPMPSAETDKGSSVTPWVAVVIAVVVAGTLAFMIIKRNKNHKGGL